jgi:hypothetical protein
VARCSLLLVCWATLLVGACGGPTSALGGRGGEQDAAEDATGNGNAPAGPEDGPADIAKEAPVSPACIRPPGGGTLAGLEVFASERPDLLQIFTSDYGPVWSEWSRSTSPSVFLGLGSGPPRLLFRGSFTGRGLRVSGAHFSFAHGANNVSYGEFAIGEINTGIVDSWQVHECGGIALVRFPCNCGTLDDSRIYAGISRYELGSGDPILYSIGAAPVDSPCTRTELLDLGSHRLYGMTSDDANVYAFVVEDEAARRYAIHAVPKSGGATTLLAAGIDPEDFLSLIPVTMAVHDGTVAWAHEDGSWPPHPRFIHVASPSTPPRTLVDETDGIGSREDVAIALDEEYLYWTTQTGFIKRIRLCGGTPEILAENQDNPIAIAVDDNAIYWLAYGPRPPWLRLDSPQLGQVMRMRKLDASGYADAGRLEEAAAPDAEGGDAGADASID